MKKFTLLLITVVLIASSTIKAQIAINTDGNSPDSSAILDLKSSSSGLLLPRMNTIQISGINNPAAGLVVHSAVQAVRVTTGAAPSVVCKFIT